MNPNDWNGHVPAAPEPTLRDVYVKLGEMHTQLLSIEHFLATCDECVCELCAKEAETA